MNKNQEIEELFQTVSQIYAKNISFLQKNYKYIYEKIKNFEALKVENYFLEFIDNHFELVDKNGIHYYKCNPFYDAQKRCENLDKKPCFELIKNTKIVYGVHYANSINANEYINEFLELPNNSALKYEKFIFLGTLLGIHLNDLAKVLNSNVYLICESSIEIFRLSLFLTDYEELSKNAKLFFCIEEVDSKIDFLIKEFLNYKTKHNHKIYFEVADEQSIHFIDKIRVSCVDYSPYNYPFNEYLVSLKRAIYYKEYSTYGILNCNKKQNIFNRPILFLGAGPSLADSIEWVYGYQDAFIVVCAAACLKRLELLGVVPDIVLSADGQYKILEQFRVDERFYKNSIVVTSVKTDLNVAKRFNMQNSFFMPDNLEVFENSGFFTGVSVGDIGLDFLLRFGAKEIYMLGFDAALSKSGASHDAIYKERTSKKEEIIVEGNFEKEVVTTPVFMQLINSINEVVSKKLNNVEIFNLSNGTYFENTIPLKKESIDFSSFSNLQKDEIYRELKSFFADNSSKTLSLQDKKRFKQELKVLNRLKSVNFEKFELEFEKLSSSYKNSLVIQIVQRFFELIDPYVVYKGSIEAKKLEFEKFLEVVEDLQKSYTLLNKEEL